MQIGVSIAFVWLYFFPEDLSSFELSVIVQSKLIKEVEKAIHLNHGTYNELKR